MLTRIGHGLLWLLEAVLEGIDRLTGRAITRYIAGGAETAYTDDHGRPRD